MMTEQISHPSSLRPNDDVIARKLDKADDTFRHQIEAAVGGLALRIAELEDIFSRAPELADGVSEELVELYELALRVQRAVEH